MCSSVNPPIPPLLAHSPIHSPITLPPSHRSVYSHFHALLPPSHLAIHYCLHPSTHSSPHSSTRLFSCEDRCARLCARLTADGVAPLWDDVRADRKQYGVALRARARSQAVRPSVGHLPAMWPLEAGLKPRACLPPTALPFPLSPVPLRADVERRKHRMASPRSGGTRKAHAARLRLRDPRRRHETATVGPRAHPRDEPPEPSSPWLSGK